jgi:hypothetical protein
VPAPRERVGAFAAGQAGADDFDLHIGWRLPVGGWREDVEVCGPSVNCQLSTAN